MTKRAVITGASGDIGEAIARQLAGEGFQLLLHYFNNEEKAVKLAASLRADGATVFLCRADLRSSAGASALREAKETAFGQNLSALVNVAGTAHFELCQDISDEAWREVMASNLDNIFFCCRAFIPDFLHQKSGAIVNVSSMWGMAGAAMESAYSAAKAGVIGFTKALARELGPSGIRANVVAPGVIAGRMNAMHDSAALAELAAVSSLGRLGTPADIAGIVSFLLSPASSYMTGQVLLADGGFLDR